MSIIVLVRMNNKCILGFRLGQFIVRTKAAFGEKLVRYQYYLSKYSGTDGHVRVVFVLGETGIT